MQSHPSTNASSNAQDAHQAQNGGNQKGYPPFLTLNTLSKKLYMPKITPPQTNTAICCERGSAIRGTLSASEIVAKAKIPSNAHSVSTTKDQNT